MFLSTQNNHSALIPIAWPNMVARAPEFYLKILRKLRIMKNINVLVGHAALVVVTEDQFIYTDFGRYITPKGFGRARSAKTDPKLAIDLKPQWSENGQLLNFEELFREMEQNAHATHGENELYASIMYDVDVHNALQYISEIQDKGFIPYSGMKKNESNCARFVTNTILRSITSSNKVFSRLSKPITISPTPFFNVIASNEDGKYYVFHQGKLSAHQEDYKISRKEILKKLSYSFRSSKSKLLPTDAQEGQTLAPIKPECMNSDAVYLGGIGEGAWYNTVDSSNDFIKVIRNYRDGNMEFEQIYNFEREWHEKLNEGMVEIVHDSHFAWVTLSDKQTGKKKRFYAKQNDGE